MENKEITFNLSLQDANLVLAALSKLPFEAVADLIAKIREQGQAQIATSESPQE